ncbi:hypothetical protein RHMOL_Rhmol12G0071200 [Rhododendron molle]|uniref:Uncharacterized protein n=1 Tax=Rhododendron molle TaxID=49168 RepID=A0ACC0LF54_RHOML|nr:hypothetical protein RHMOL_Rhmol12G0071200 [Rhododendron molle]
MPLHRPGTIISSNLFSPISSLPRAKLLKTLGQQPRLRPRQSCAYYSGTPAARATVASQIQIRAKKSRTATAQFSLSGNYPYHKFCYKEHYRPKCDVCKHFISTNVAGLIKYRAHPFWVQKYCLFHEHDGTPRCCSCERMEVSLT